jgi:hypothetical protein
MIERLDIVGVEGKAFMMGLVVVKALPDARQSSNSNGTQANDVGGTKVIDVWGNPATVIKLPKMRAGLVIASNEDGQKGGSPFARVILGEVTKFAVLDRTRHDGEVFRIANCLDRSVSSLDNNVMAPDLIS